ncbi:hypothetical protein KEM48_009563 [Puccinia striiformis f. sp. tritici PST-130]|nr:hypothetical protein KEM48_009730 [Puccinia striiformis f. sp. tritici PST-130]KAI9623133.1 hypothetical protein KEM48_009563 [Puccinia striiformis f. sp. tritici PST-130]
MLKIFTLTALASLMALCGATTPPDVHFGCHKKIDALCSYPDPNNWHVTWAERIHPHTRDYKCIHDRIPLCCPKHYFDIDSFVKLIDFGNLSRKTLPYLCRWNRLETVTPTANDQPGVGSNMFAPIPAGNSAPVERSDFYRFGGTIKALAQHPPEASHHK